MPDLIRRFRRLTVQGWLVLAGAGALAAPPVADPAAGRANMPLAVETPYSEAAVAYYSGNYRLAIKILDKIEATGIAKIRVMELKALALQYDGQYQEGVELYRLLLQTASEQNIPPLELVLYDYQTGVLMMQKKRYLEARLHLERSLQKGINRAYTAYLLGLANFRLGDDRNASLYLRAAFDKGSEITRPSAAYYLGLVFSRTGDMASARLLWHQAKTEVERIDSNPEITPALHETMRQLGNALDTALGDELNRRFTGNVGVVTAYDSNPVLMPTVDAKAYGQGTITQLFRYNLGVHTSSSRNFDFIPVLSGFTNFNTNPDTSISQYFVQDAGMIFALSPRANLRYGLRLDGRYLGRYDRAAGSTIATEGFDGSLGLFLQAQSSSHSEWGLEFFSQYLDFQTDPQFDSRLAMSGTNFELRGHYAFTSRKRGWNPGIDLGLFYQNTDGTEWRAFGTELGLSDGFRFSENFIWLLRLAVNLSSYSDRVVPNTEFPYRIGWDLTYRWGEHLRFGSQVSYLRNDDGAGSAYTYQRFIVNGSMDYFF